MSDRDALQSLCLEWRRLSESEGAAIGMSNWTAVAECQKRKQALQPQISSEARRVGASLDDQETGPLVRELIALELRNREALALQSQKAREQKDAIARSSRDLRRVRSAYSSRPDPVWNSFS